MSRRAATLAGVLLLSAALVVHTPAQTQTPPTFRATAEVVSVAVTVESNGEPVGGLAASDFVLSDNGVQQRLDAVEGTAMPMDVTLLADMSSQTAGAISSHVSVADNLERLKRDVSAMAAQLQPEDRLRVLTVDTYVSQPVPLQAPAMAPDIGNPPAGGLTSLYDALTTALMSRVEPGRRHIIVTWTKPLDTISAIDAGVVREVARRSDATVHVVLRDMAPLAMGEYQELTRSWRPYTRREPGLLTDVAEVTGGTVHGIGVLSNSTGADVFETVAATLRHSYVLRYTPERVSPGGWHDIVVKVPRLPGADVRARRGYAGAPTAPPAARPRTADATAEIVRPFDEGNLAATRAALRRRDDLRRAMRDYRASGGLWPSDPRRDATFALLMAQVGLFSGDDGAHDEALALLAQEHDLVRQPLGADAFECQWYEAEVALYQGTFLAEQATAAATSALARCPANGVLVLGLAIANDQLWSTSNARANASRAARTATGNASDVLAKYDAAAAIPAVAAEAHVRAAWLAYRTHNLNDALTRLDRADRETADNVITFLSRFVRGRVLYARGDRDAAREAYRAALNGWPGAQSARVALMTLLVTSGDRQGAEAEAEAVQAAADTAIDPWWLYWQGDYRRFDSLLTTPAEGPR